MSKADQAAHSHVVYGFYHVAGISFIAAEIASPVCDPWKFFALSIALWGE